MHPAAYRFVRRALPALDLSGLRILEFGSLDVNSTEQGLDVRGLCEGVACYVGVDIRPGPGVDIVCDAAVFETTEPFDVCICMEVLEHTPNAAAIIEAARRALRSGGLLILTAAGKGRRPHGVDGGGVGREYYRNVSADDLRQWLAEWEILTIEENRTAHDIYAVARTINPLDNSERKAYDTARGSL